MSEVVDLFGVLIRVRHGGFGKAVGRVQFGEGKVSLQGSHDSRSLHVC